jgi:peroxin-5
VEINPKDHNAWNKLGAILAHSKMNDEAISTYHKALSLKPNYARCWANLGIALFNVDNHKESMKAFLSALKIFRDIPHVWSYMSSVTIAMGRNDLYEMVHNKNLDGLIKSFGI